MSLPVTELAPVEPEALVRNYHMDDLEVQAVDIDGEPYANEARTYDRLGIAVPTVAKVRAGRIQEFAVLDTRDNSEYNTSLLIVTAAFRRSYGHRGYKGVREGAASVHIGRSHHKGRFDYQPGVSRDHFTAALRGSMLWVANLRPLNGTWLSGNLVQRSDEPVYQRGLEDLFTQNAQIDLYGSPDLEPADQESPHGYYRGRKIIGRKSTSVKNGVYFTESSEVAVVDSDSSIIQAAQHDLLETAWERFGTRDADVRDVLRFVNAFTRQVLPYNLRRTERLCEPHYDHLGMINLSKFISERAGVCRHQNLLAALFMETLIDNGLLQGQVGVERNHDLDAHGAHAWAVLKRPNGQVLIVDPTAGTFVGTKQEAEARGMWRYHLSAEE